MISLRDIEVLATDWDETVTETDTIALLAEAAYDHKPDLDPKWSYYVEAYMKDYEEYMTCKGEGTDLDTEAEILRGLDAVDSASLKRIEQGKVFHDVPRETILAKAKKISFRPGWWEMYEEARKRGIRVVILSINWSGELIRQVFRDAGYSPDDITITSNDIEMGDNGRGTGCIIAPLRTAGHKEDVIKNLKKQHNGRLCYVGDSSTDLLAIVAADMGVVMAKRGLAEKLRRLGVDVSEHTENPSGKVYYTPDWTGLKFDSQ